MEGFEDRVRVEIFDMKGMILYSENLGVSEIQSIQLPHISGTVLLKADDGIHSLSKLISIQ
jgi:hypothetical protein